MTRVLIVGDTHSDGTFVANVLREGRTAYNPPPTVVVQLGDFGFTFDANMIASITAWLARDPENVFYWIDGNHDDHDFIEDVIMDGYDGSEPINMGTVRRLKGNYGSGKEQSFPDRLFYCPRGSVWNIGKRTCMALGGGYSIDKDYRTPGVSWWPQELIREGDKDFAIDQAREFGPIDVLFSHDIPICETFEHNLNTNGYKVGPESYANRLMLSKAVDGIKPRSLYHGHYHHRHEDLYESHTGWKVKVHGIGANVAGHYIDHTAKEEWNYVVREW